MLSATASAGYAIARRLGQRVELIDQMERLLQYLITEIDYGLTPLPQALEHSSRALGEAMNSFCAFVVRELEKGKALGEAWEMGTVALLENTSLRSEDVAPLLTLAPVLGLSDRPDQLRHLKLAGEHLRAVKRDAELEARKNQTLWRYTGVLSGLVLVLLLM